MGTWRHILTAITTLASLGSPVLGGDTPDDPLRFFAHCTGRLSAEMSHRATLAQPGVEDVATLRASFITLVQALTPEGHGREVLSWRIDARAAHSALLSRATFQQDAWAASRAEAEVAHCVSLVLGPQEAPADTGDPAPMPPMPASQPVP